MLVENPLFFFTKNAQNTEIFIFIDNIQLFCAANFACLFLLRIVSELFTKWKDVNKCRKNKILNFILILHFVGLWCGLRNKPYILIPAQTLFKKY